MNSREWLDKVLREEYLRDFIPGGGAAVKFAVGSADVRTSLREGLRELARTEGSLFAAVDAAATKTHMVDHLFHEVARQVDWNELAYNFVSRIIVENGLHVPSTRSDFSLAAIAGLNGQAELLLRNDVKQWLTQMIFYDYQMSQEFRIAMIRLCMAQLDPEEKDSFLTNAVTEWLRGELRLISAVKEALIFQKVARHNARHMLFSLTHWLKLCGKRGLVLWLDVSRYTAASRALPPDGFFYSTPAVMDGYEVLRQFIDGTDEMECCLVIVGTATEFLTDTRRGLDCYDALRLRISDEVRDRARENPLSSLVRVSAVGIEAELVTAGPQ